MSTLDLPGREAYQSSHQDLSPAATTVAFDPVLPLVRIPVAAGEGDDTSKGPYVLAFRNEQTWRQSWLNCQDKIASQCEAGAKVGCSISAAKACQAPWWMTYFPFLNKAQHDQSSREECERREMTECLRSSQERCTGYAREICDPIFSNVRIAAPGAPIDPRFNGRRLQRPRVSRHDKVVQKLPKKSWQAEQTESQGILHKTSSGAETLVEERPKLGVTTFRGRLVMQYERLGERERSSRQRLQGTQGNGVSSIQQSSTLPGFVGGLVHPVVQSTDLPNSVENHVVAKVPVILRLDWWQKLQQLWLDRVRF